MNQRTILPSGLQFSPLEIKIHCSFSKHQFWVSNMPRSDSALGHETETLPTITELALMRRDRLFRGICVKTNIFLRSSVKYLADFQIFFACNISLTYLCNETIQSRRAVCLSLFIFREPREYSGLPFLHVRSVN